ncbi:inhibin beta B chain-like [Petromyzon marinus]|uniref:inhibin beta B chain-like n=1 Tax=Petromyzon marinus TaxID=7757 RepID=UPI003F6F3F19
MRGPRCEARIVASRKMHTRTGIAFAFLVTACTVGSPLDPQVATQGRSDLAAKVSTWAKAEVGVTAKSKLDKHDCPSCDMAFLRRVEEKQGEALLVEAVKRHILNKLGLHERPTTIRPIPRLAMLAAVDKLHHTKRGKRGNGDPEETQRGHDFSEIISFASFDGWHSGALQLRLDFPAEQQLRVAWLRSAELWLHVHAAEGGPRLPDGTAAAALLRVRVRSAGAPAVEVQRRVLVTAKDAWVAVPLLDAVRATLQRADGALAGGSRTRRRSVECDGSSSLCCLQRFYVEFRKINWGDWIIQPAGFQSNYCQGECRGAQVLNGTSSASSLRSVIINQYNLRGLGPVAAKTTCCVPVRFSSVSMLYYDDKNNIQKKDVPDMVAEECGCI